MASGILGRPFGSSPTLGVLHARGHFLTTENVAILFTDVVGSTELSQRLSSEAADEVRRGHFSILRQAMAEAGGTEVKNLGDGLMVVFGSASAALACAVAMQQGVERDNRDREHTVGLRVGLSGGEVSREDDDYFGDPVVEAARLCATCESGQILAADIVRAMAGRRSRHQCRSLGDLTLKGLPDPIETVEVLWEPLEGPTDSDKGTVVPLPGRLAVRPGVGVVGRDAEMQLMTDAAKRVAGGEGREVLLISGEAGMGKTTLVAEAARTAFDNGACVLFGHCERGPRHPLSALRRIPWPLRNPRRRGPAGRPRRAPRVRTGSTGACPGQPDPRPPTVEGHRHRNRALPAVCGGRRSVGQGVRAAAHRPRPR